MCWLSMSNASSRGRQGVGIKLFCRDAARPEARERLKSAIDGLEAQGIALGVSPADLSTKLSMQAAVTDLLEKAEAACHELRRAFSEDTCLAPGSAGMADFEPTSRVRRTGSDTPCDAGLKRDVHAQSAPSRRHCTAAVPGAARPDRDRGGERAWCDPTGTLGTGERRGRGARSTWRSASPKPSGRARRPGSACRWPTTCGRRATARPRLTCAGSTPRDVYSSFPPFDSARAAQAYIRPFQGTSVRSTLRIRRSNR